MANAVYPIYKGDLLGASANVSLNVDTSTDGPFCALVDTGTYTYSAAHDFYNDLSGIVGTDQRITAPTVTIGTLDGTDLTYTAVSGATVEALVIYRKNSGANTTWRLVVFLDTSQTGLPVTPNGGNITISWHASGIFTISDRDVKEDVVQVGSVGPANVYEFCYRGQKKRQLGLMAQEVEQFAPEAVREIGGCKRVDYASALSAAERLAA